MAAQPGLTSTGKPTAWPANLMGGSSLTRAAGLSGTTESGVYWNQIQREEKVRDTGRSIARWNWGDLAEPRRLELKLLREGVSRR